MDTINEVEDPAAVIAIPTKKDVDYMEEIIQTSYQNVAEEYEQLRKSGKATNGTERRGSLCQEVLAQLHNQMED